MTITTTARRTDVALAELDEIGDAGLIADYLLGLGIRGWRHHAGRCPVAVFLHKVTGKPHIVGPTTCHRLDDEAADEDEVNFAVPDRVQDFIAKFDHAVYPALQARHDYVPAGALA